jgi:nitric oxide reductase subunit B
MVFLDLFPVGVWQFKTVTENGLWFARSSAFIGSMGFQTFTWLRIIGGAIFTLGGVVPLVWLIVRKRKSYTKTAMTEMITTEIISAGQEVIGI